MFCEGRSCEGAACPGQTPPLPLPFRKGEGSYWARFGANLHRHDDTTKAVRQFANSGFVSRKEELSEGCMSGQTPPQPLLAQEGSLCGPTWQRSATLRNIPPPTPPGSGGELVRPYRVAVSNVAGHTPHPCPSPLGKGEGSLCGPTCRRSATLWDIPPPTPPGSGGELVRPYCPQVYDDKVACGGNLPLLFLFPGRGGCFLWKKTVFFMVDCS